MAGTILSAVAYYRMSTDRQEASIPDQRLAVEKLARDRGYRIVREYADEGISGDDTERRLDFRRMLDDATRLGDFEAVLCWDQDRFGRFDPLEAGYWVKPLRDRGVYLETVAQGKIDWEDFAGRIIYSVQQEGKHAFLRDMSRNVTRGMLAKAKRGEWLGGTVPYGYALNDHKRLTPGPAAEVETVRWLFAAYAETDTSLRALSMDLNARGVPGPDKRKNSRKRTALWCPTGVQKILTRPTYLGHTAWNKRHEGKYHQVADGEIQRAARKRGWANDRAHWVVAEDTHEPLVDAALFERVQRRLVERRDRKTPNVGGGGFLFTGLLRCGHCGWPMHGTNLHYRYQGRPAKHRRYICGNYNLHGTGKGGCRCNTVLESVLLDVIVRKLQEEFLRPKNLAALRAEIRRQVEAERAGRAAPAADCERRIAELTRKIETGTERYLTAPAAITADLGAKLEEWRRERELLERRRRELAKPAASVEDLDAAVAKVEAGLATLRERAAEADPALVRQVIRELVERIDLTFRHVQEGSRVRAYLDGGTVRLRESLVCADVSIDVPRGSRRGTTLDKSAHPLANLLTFRFGPDDCGAEAPDRRRERAAEVLKRHPDWSDRAVARSTRLNHHSVGAIRRALEAAGAIPRRRAG